MGLNTWNIPSCYLLQAEHHAWPSFTEKAWRDEFGAERLGWFFVSPQGEEWPAHHADGTGLQAREVVIWQPLSLENMPNKSKQCNVEKPIPTDSWYLGIVGIQGFDIADFDFYVFYAPYYFILFLFEHFSPWSTKLPSAGPRPAMACFSAGDLEMA